MAWDRLESIVIVFIDFSPCFMVFILQGQKKIIPV